MDHCQLQPNKTRLFWRFKGLVIWIFGNEGYTEKYLKGRPEVSTENRMRILRLIENMTLGRNAVGYLTESLHGAGSPQAQRIQIGRQMQLEFKKQLAQLLAGIADPDSAEEIELSINDYFGRVFRAEPVESDWIYKTKKALGHPGLNIERFWLLTAT